MLGIGTITKKVFGTPNDRLSQAGRADHRPDQRA